MRGGDATLAIVRQVLQQYADRGVFLGFSEHKGRGGWHEFKFRWLTRRPMELAFEPRSGRFRFRNLLPDISSSSRFYSELKTFVEGRASRKLPEHRRVNPRYAELRCGSRGNAMWVQLRMRQKKHAEYATRKAVNLVNEIFLQLHTWYPEYMWAQFGTPQE
jgi:hypothetical protein